MAYLTSQGGQPVLILKEGTSRKRGRDAQTNNIMAAKIISEVLKSTLGPRGMDKMIIDSLGDITITNDGAAILDEIDVEHPAAKMMVEVAKTQDDEVGDGTTTSVILAGELLEEGEDLLEQGIHPTIVVSGYRKALEKVKETLDKIGIKINLEDREILKQVALTSMGSKAVGAAKDHLSEIIIDAVKQITEMRGDKNVVDIDNIQIIKKEGKSLFETELIRGIIVDKEVVHSGMPKRIENAKIALVNTAFEVEKTEFSSEIRISDPSQMQAFLDKETRILKDKETRILKDMVAKVKNAGADVLICQKGIDDLAQHFMAKDGILAVRRAKESDMEKLARATGGKIVNKIDDISSVDLGEAGIVEERKIGDDRMIVVEKCKDPRSVTVLIRAGLERMVDEAERAIHDALSVVSDVTEHNVVVAGGGAVEAEIAKELRGYATKIGGREQLAIEAFANSMEIVPKALAENAGLESIDILVALRSAHDKPKGHLMGIDVFSGKIVDTYERGVIEPVKVKMQAVKSATEVASMILRIDDVIAATKPKEGKEGVGPED
jgi:thermosome